MFKTLVFFKFAYTTSLFLSHCKRYLRHIKSGCEFMCLEVNQDKKRKDSLGNIRVKSAHP